MPLGTKARVRKDSYAARQWTKTATGPENSGHADEIGTPRARDGRKIRREEREKKRLKGRERGGREGGVAEGGSHKGHGSVLGDKEGAAAH